MGRLVAAGGVYVPSESVRPLERALDELCEQTGFPTGEEFKWSPEKRQWMHKKLTLDARATFFERVLAAAGAQQVTAIVVIEDTTKSPANRGATAEQDVVT